MNVNAILYLRTHPVILIFFPFPPFLFVSSCLTGFLTIVYQVSPTWGPRVQAFSLIACLPPACSPGSPLSTFQTTLIITPLGPACSRHLRSLAGRFVSLPLLLSPCHCLCAHPSSVPPHLTPTLPSPRLSPHPLSFTLCLLPHNAPPSGSSPWGRTRKQPAALRQQFPQVAGAQGFPSGDSGQPLIDGSAVCIAGSGSPKLKGPVLHQVEICGLIPPRGHLRVSA